MNIFKKRLSIFINKHNLKNNETALIQSPVDCYYYSGFNSSNAFILCGNETSYYLTDGRYAAEAAKKIKHLKIILINKQLPELIHSLIKTKTLIIDSSVSIEFYNLLTEKINHKKIQIVKFDFTKLRSIKTDDEISMIKKSAAVLANSVPLILKIIRPGMNEVELKNEIEYSIQLKGAEAAAFNTIVLFGKHTVFPHGHPSLNSKLKNKDIILADFGAKIGGYCTDITRMISVGDGASKKFKNTYNLLYSIRADALEKIKIGGKFSDIEHYIIDSLKKFSLDKYYLHSTGHGVGLEVHERPSVNRRSSDIIENNQIFTIEPGIYIPDNFGIRIEDMYYMKNNKLNCITSAISDQLLTINEYASKKLQKQS